MPRLPIIEALIKYKSENNNYLAMPGHKCGKVLEDTEEGQFFLNNLLQYDVTEVDGMDNFHNPDGIIKEAQEELAKYYGSKKSFFLVNGSTSGNMIMIFSVFNEFDKIIVERNCHRSIYNGIVLRKLKPIYIKSEISSKYDAPFAIDKKHLFSTMKSNKDAKAILLTYPNYYGLCSHLKEIIEKAKQYNMKVLIDSAHGAHFGACEGLPKNAVELGADIVVHSAHKTLPSLTQTSFLHVNCSAVIDKIEYYTSVFSTTSPSYIFMASLDYSRYYLQKYGEEKYNELISLCNEYRNKINELNKFHIISKEDGYKNKSEIGIDLTRYIINLPRGYSGHLLLRYLKVNGIQGEMSDNRNVVLIFGTSNKKQDFEHLYKVLLQCNTEELKDKYSLPIDYHIPNVKIMPWQALELEKLKCNIEDSINKICGQAIVPYPPGIPIVMPGEVIDKDIISSIEYYIKSKVTLLGIEEGKITILKV